MRWYTLRAAWEYRGGGALTTFMNTSIDQPALGIPDAYMRGRRVWSAETVEHWAEVTDGTREQYLEELVNGAGGEVYLRRLRELGKTDRCPHRDFINRLSPALPELKIS